MKRLALENVHEFFLEKKLSARGPASRRYEYTDPHASNSTGVAHETTLGQWIEEA